MRQSDILELIQSDPWMMEILSVAESLHLANWVIGAGFVRNKVWDHLHGRPAAMPDTSDIDLVYFDPGGNNQEEDEALSLSIQEKTDIPWEIVNQVYAHGWNDVPPYTSVEDALAHWPETATSVGVRRLGGFLELIAPYGINDLVNLVVRPSPLFPEGAERVMERAREKRWLEKWPNLKIVTNEE